MPRRSRAFRLALGILWALCAPVLTSGCGKPPADSAPATGDIIEGRYRAVIVDAGHPLPVAGGGRTASAALTCQNPNCSGKGTDGRPFLFTRPSASRGRGAAGGDLTPEQKREEQESPIACPACGETRWVVVYELPETKRRREQLDIELQATREILQAAAAQGLQLPPGSRTPAQIMEEKAGLPRLYLLDER